MNKPIYQGEVIRMINDKTNVVVEKLFEDSLSADCFEDHLDLMGVHYQRFSRGELLYENRP